MKTHLAGVDEVGRGCLFGPVIAAAVILGSNKIFGLKDSKKLTRRNSMPTKWNSMTIKVIHTWKYLFQ